MGGVPAEPPAPEAEAIVVPNGSPIADLTQLKGKKVALNRGSNVHYLLLRALRSAGLQVSDVEVVYLAPADARSAFELLPGALPSILVGLRFALGLAWLVLIVAESIGAQRGLGYVAMTAREFMQMEPLVLTILLWALLGKLADVLARRLERWLLPWQPRAQRLAAE